MESSIQQINNVESTKILTEKKIFDIDAEMAFRIAKFLRIQECDLTHKSSFDEIISRVRHYNGLIRDKKIKPMNEAVIALTIEKELRVEDGPREILKKLQAEELKVLEAIQKIEEVIMKNLPFNDGFNSNLSYGYKGKRFNPAYKREQKKIVPLL